VAPHGRWTPVSKEREDLPAALDEIIDKGLSSRPRSRYQNAQEYLNAIDGLRLAPQPVPVPEPPKPVPPVPRPRRRIGLWIALGIVAMLFVFYLIGTQGGGGGIGNAPVPPVVPPSNPEQENVKPAVPSTPGRPVQSVIPESRPVQSVKPEPEPEPEPETIPEPVHDANFQGTWFDELAGSGIAQYRIVLWQTGKLVNGAVYQMNGIQYGTISGFVNRNILDYKYYSPFGNGFGRGVMAPDGDVDVLVNGTQRRVMHRNHMPG
jgi:hypothetical protein